jgi:hypothetical protein
MGLDDRPAQLKHNRDDRTIASRGPAAAHSEGKLIGAKHNLLKLWRFVRQNHPPIPTTPHRTATPGRTTPGGSPCDSLYCAISNRNRPGRPAGDQESGR